MRSTSELDVLARGIRGYRGAHGDNALERLRPGECCISNYQSDRDARGGSHWICARRFSNFAVAFDSYGMACDEPLRRACGGVPVISASLQTQFGGTDCGDRCVRFLRASANWPDDVYAAAAEYADWLLRELA